MPDKRQDRIAASARVAGAGLPIGRDSRRSFCWSMKTWTARVKRSSQAAVCGRTAHPRRGHARHGRVAADLIVGHVTDPEALRRAAPGEIPVVILDDA